MVTDIRISIGFFANKKTRKLRKLCGEKGIICLLKLWIHAAMSSPNGELQDMDAADIEEVTQWEQNRPGELAQALEDVGFIENINGTFWLHDWQEHNPWVADEENRSNKNRFSQLANHMPDIYKLLKNAGIQEISKEHYRAIKSSKSPVSEAKKLFAIKRPKNDAADVPTHTPTTVTTTPPTVVTTVVPTNVPTPSHPLPSLLKDKKAFKSLSLNLSQDTPYVPPTPPVPDETENAKGIKAGDEREKPKSTLPHEEEPDMEFRELRDIWDEFARPEGTFAGFIEFKTLKRSRQWPGLGFIRQDLMERIEGGFWDKGYEPSLGRYLKDRVWEQKTKTRLQRAQIKTFAEIESEREKARREARLAKAREYDRQRDLEAQQKAAKCN